MDPPRAPGYALCLACWAQQQVTESSHSEESDDPAVVSRQSLGASGTGELSKSTNVMVPYSDSVATACSTLTIPQDGVGDYSGLYITSMSSAEEWCPHYVPFLFSPSSSDL